MGSQEATKLRKKMKKTIFFCKLLVVTFFMSCGSSKDVTSAYGTHEKLNETEEYALQAPGRRCAAMYQSQDEMIATQAALALARSNYSEALSSAVVDQATVRGVDKKKFSGGMNDGFVVSDGGTDANVFAEVYSSNILKNVYKVKTDKFHNGKNGVWTIFVCVEYGGTADELVKQAISEIKKRLPEEEWKKLEKDLDSYENDVKKKLISNLSK